MTCTYKMYIGPGLFLQKEKEEEEKKEKKKGLGVLSRAPVRSNNLFVMIILGLRRRSARPGTSQIFHKIPPRTEGCLGIEYASIYIF